jgi:hypothetical protein
MVILHATSDKNRGENMTEQNTNETPNSSAVNQKPQTSRQTKSIIVLIVLLVILAAVAIWNVRRERIATEDANGDGRPDSWLYYDPYGRPLLYEKDRNYDGKIDWRDTFVWDEAKKKPRIAKTDVDADYNGTFDTHIFYRADMQMDRLERDANNDGRIDIVSIYDLPNKPPLRVEIDQDGDGQFETVKLRVESSPTPAPQAAPAPQADH